MNRQVHCQSISKSQDDLLLLFIFFTVNFKPRLCSLLPQNLGLTRRAARLSSHSMRCKIKRDRFKQER